MRLIPIVALLLATPAAADTLLIGNKAENTLSFVDLGSGREVKRIATGPMPHEVAVSPDGTLAAVVSYGGTGIDVVDVRRQRRIRTIDLAPDGRPHGIVWLRDNRLVVTTETNDALLLVNAATNAIVRVPTGRAKPHMVAVSPDQRRAYVANIDGGAVTVIDLDRAAKVADVPTGGKPEGVAVALGGRQLWVGDNTAGRVSVWDTETLKKVGEVAVPPFAIRVLASPDGRTIATSNARAGSVTLIDAATRRVVRTIAVGGPDSGQVTLLFSPDGRRLYVAETGPDTIAEVDVARGTVLRRLPAGRDGDGLAIVSSRP